MAYSEKKGISSTTKDRLAIASLVLAVIAMFGVIPLSGFLFLISCEIVDWIGCTDIEYAIGFFDYSCYSSIAVSTLAIILGFISYPGAEKDSTTQILALVGIGMGFFVWPLVLFTGFLLWLVSAWV